MKGPLRFLLRWAVTAVAVMVATRLVSGITYASPGALAVAALLLGLLNAFVRPLLILVSVSLVLFTFGLFLWVINALLLYFVGNVVPGFTVTGFWPALWGAAVISLTSMLFNALLPGERRPARPQGRRRPGDRCVRRPPAGRRRSAAEPRGSQPDAAPTASAGDTAERRHALRSGKRNAAAPPMGAAFQVPSRKLRAGSPSAFRQPGKDP